MGDADFGRVIDNLVSNALAAVPERESRHIRMRLGEDLCIEVDDNGPGMDPEYIAFAFDRFSRERVSRPRRGWARAVDRRRDSRNSAGKHRASQP